MNLNRILCLVLMFVGFAANAQSKFTLKTVVIDAGHGGKDPGAIGQNKTNEKDIALVVALKLGDYIQKQYPNVNVIYTRKTDVFLELHERAAIANKNKADLFIAVHVNSSPNKETYGTSTYVLGLHRTEANLEVAKRENSVINLEDDKDKNYDFDPNTPEGHIIMSMKQNAFLDQSIDFASKVENQFENYAKRKSLGVKQAGFYVLYKTAMPSILAEIGFISNAEEEKYLNSVKGQDLIATGLFNAFKDYKTELEGSEGAQYAYELAVEQQKQEVKTETKPVTKTETKPEVITETKVEVKTEAKPETKPEVKAETKPEVKPEVKPETKPTATQTEKNYTTIASGANIRKPVENATGGGKSTAPKNNVYGDDVQPIYVTQSTVDPFDTTSFSNMGKQTAKPATTKTETKPEVKTETKAPETKLEVKTETKVETKSETKPANTTTPASAAAKHPQVADHKTEGGTIFKVQLFALKGELKEYEKVSKLFGANSLSAEVLDNGFIRYYAGSTASVAEAAKLLQTAKGGGYANAVIVGFKNGTRMSTDEVNKLINK